VKSANSFAPNSQVGHLLPFCCWRYQTSIASVKHFERRGVAYLIISGKGDKTRYVPLPIARALVLDYLEAAGHGALFSHD
jgi:hypothetical protein